MEDIDANAGPIDPHPFAIAMSVHPYPAKAEEVSQRESSIRTQNNMTYTNIKSHTFVCGRFDDFVLMPSVST